MRDVGLPLAVSEQDDIDFGYDDVSEWVCLRVGYLSFDLVVGGRSLLRRGGCVGV